MIVPRRLKRPPGWITVRLATDLADQVEFIIKHKKISVNQFVMQAIEEAVLADRRFRAQASAGED